MFMSMLHQLLSNPSHRTGPRASFLQSSAGLRVILAVTVLGALWLVLLASLSATD